jgi:hypothetical protein
MQWVALLGWRASNPIISPSLLQCASIQQASCAAVQQQLHLNFADVARHHVLQYACSPARRRHEVHARAGRRGRCSVTRFHRKAEHDAHSLSCPKRDLHAADGLKGLIKHGAWHRKAAREAQRGLDEQEWGVDLESLHNGNAHGLAHEAIGIFKCQGWATKLFFSASS